MLPKDVPLLRRPKPGCRHPDGWLLIHGAFRFFLPSSLASCESDTPVCHPRGRVTLPPIVAWHALGVVDTLADAGRIHPGVQAYFQGALGWRRRVEPGIRAAPVRGTGSVQFFFGMLGARSSPGA